MAIEGHIQGFTVQNSITLALLTLAFIVGEMSHFLIGSMSLDMARDIHYGTMQCYLQKDMEGMDGYTQESCKEFETEEVCNAANSTSDANVTNICMWEYTGRGLEYQVIAGPVFVVIFTFSGVIMGFLGDKVVRTRLLGVCIMLFSVCGTVTAFVQTYWQLVVLRMGIAAGEAALRPIAGSLLADLFDAKTRGVANGIFSWGVYIGYGFTFILGNYVPDADILGYGWRAAYVIGCSLGIPIAVVLFFHKDPRETAKQRAKKRESKDETGSVISNESVAEKVETKDVDPIIAPEKESEPYWRVLFKALIQPSMVLLFVAAAVRHTGGYTWSYNTQNFFNEYYPEQNPGIYLAMCSIIGGSFGVFAGGFISDLAVRKLGLYSRLWIQGICLILATPFAVGVLTLDPPYDYVMLLIYYFFSETWFAVLFTVIVEIVPAEIRSACIGIFLFLMNNIGGNLPTLVAVLSKETDLKTSLYIFFPGFVGASAILFFVASLPLYFQDKAQRKAKLVTQE